MRVNKQRKHKFDLVGDIKLHKNHLYSINKILNDYFSKENLKIITVKPLLLRFNKSFKSFFKYLETYFTKFFQSKGTLNEIVSEKGLEFLDLSLNEEEISRVL